MVGETANTGKVLCQCDGCDRTRSVKGLVDDPSKPKTPSEWHRDKDGRMYCEKCWADRYMLRAITLPIASPVEMDWNTFRDVLSDMWAKSTNTANWAVKQLLSKDVVRDISMRKLPPMPPVYLYGELPADAKAGWSTSCQSVLKTVERKYRARRYELIWLREVSLPNTKYPYPFPFCNQNWKASIGDGGEPLVRLTLPGQRVTLRVRFGQRGKRNRIAASFGQIASGAAVPGEAAILRRRSDGTHRGGITDRDSGGQRAQYEVVVKLVAWFPRPAKGEAKGTLFVRSDTDFLLVALDEEDERIWVANADHINRWTMDHARQIQRWSDDQKAEQRPTASFQSRREASAEKYRRRMDSAVKEIAAQVVNFAARRKKAAIRYDDSVKTFCPRFPWAALAFRIRTKCDEIGMAFERCTGKESVVIARNDATQGTLS